MIKKEPTLTIDQKKIGNEKIDKYEEEHNGYKGADPTKYNDWQHKGRVTDF